MHNAIQFTQEQARSLAGVTEGDLRHWRKLVPYLSGKVGKAARFTFSEVVALGLLAELTHSYGVRLTQIAGGAEAMFRLLSPTMPAQFDRGIVLLTGEGALLVTPQQLAAAAAVSPALIVPCAPVAGRIRTAIMADGGVDALQRSLPFPPKVVRSGSRSP